MVNIAQQPPAHFGQTFIHSSLVTGDGRSRPIGTLATQSLSNANAQALIPVAVTHPDVQGLTSAS